MATTVPNYYRILHLESQQHDSTLSPQQVKRAYKQACLLYHPDKSTTRLGPTSVTTDERPTIDQITLAYQTLSDPVLRAEYDRRLALAGCKSVSDASDEDTRLTGLETVDLDDLTVEPTAADEPGRWTRGCRCGDGGGFVVPEALLEANADVGEVVVGCKGCSLWLRVLFGTET